MMITIRIILISIACISCDLRIYFCSISLLAGSDIFLLFSNFDVLTFYPEARGFHEASWGSHPEMGFHILAFLVSNVFLF